MEMDKNLQLKHTLEKQISAEKLSLSAIAMATIVFISCFFIITLSAFVYKLVHYQEYVFASLLFTFSLFVIKKPPS